MQNSGANLKKIIKQTLKFNKTESGYLFSLKCPALVSTAIYAIKDTC